MKKTKKLLNKSQGKFIIGVIVGGLIFGSIGVYAATYFPSNQTTYDNTASGLQSTNVQDAIDELYGICLPPKTGGEAILDDVDIVTSGDGLYADEYEAGKYTYKGVNPNNYVTFNNEEAGWRIISINSDRTIKIVRTVSIGDIAWDTSNSSNWNRPTSLNTYLNGDYYNSLTSTAQGQIVESTYYAGAVTWANNDMQNQINEEKETISKVRIALPTLSEYIRAGSNKSCKTFSTYQSNYSTCKNFDWMFMSNINYLWMLSPYSGVTNVVLAIYLNGRVYSGSASTTIYAVRPTVTLSSEVQITGGDGSQSNPYTLS